MSLQMEYLYTIPNSPLTKSVILHVNNGLSTEHGTEWRKAVVRKIASNSECLAFGSDIGKYMLQIR
jgi:hypothetical protein